ncbi:hydroxypyruvate isomerase [Pseudomonas citronellolis]|uniref:hydroxypyruvate isomerase family protein n=1 Tax=Pseudomonas citronellolis TaxID=53408 RepID=UPI00209C7C08|nr:TIM barrel protein [Pseudomonas citronellolis]MCP1642350.1 hydroxypyruvate isomerase [Pseudomonas citronellolis]MCP1665539.1 hydroxypyruvate isomerase [Pseudomonas citronellolis]MCP1696183.1 hydroxypyruvate isomerase [Pseudomonas citronellolis]MCP1703076.1 hydroxypyruvate isomerase [Pseudomonas citronellolis]MCP1796963.1 hydroxypyruvate isomerase [Pseudomonas citronellolis]
MPICANLSLLFTELPLIERVRAAAEAGFAGVEIQFPYEVPAAALQAELQRSGMPLVLFNLPAGDLMQGGAGLAAVPGREAQFAAGLRQALDYAEVARPQKINVLAGRLAEGVEREQALALLAEHLRQTAEAFAGRGIAVLMEAINLHDMPGFLLNTPQHLLDMLARVGHPNLAAQLDFYHMARMGLDLADCVRQLQGHIGHVQFADAPGRGEPGSGELDFGPALAALRAQGYAGWLGAEYRPQGATSAGLGWLPAWRERLQSA